MSNRTSANKKIVECISAYLAENPDIRFHQALQNLGIESRFLDADDLWNEESEDTLSKMTMVAVDDEEAKAAKSYASRCVGMPILYAIAFLAFLGWISSLCDMLYNVLY